MSQQIQIRRDLAANWTSVNPILAQGELGLETDTNKIKIGNGSTVWASLAYSISIDHTALSNIGTNSHATIDTHLASTSNPHSVTKTQVGLANVDNTSDVTKFAYTEQTDSSSTGGTATIATPTSPVLRITNASLTGITNIPSPTNLRTELILINLTGNKVLLVAGGNLISDTDTSIPILTALSLSWSPTTSKWYVNGTVGSFVNTTSNQTIAGVKTFSAGVEFNSTIDFLVQRPNFYNGINIIDGGTFMQASFSLSPTQTVVTDYILPPDNGSAGQFLKNNGSGVLAWDTASGGAGVPATTVTSETTYGISSVVGTSTNYAREDHTHGTMATPTKTTVGLANVQNLDQTNPVNITQDATHRFTNDTDVTRLAGSSGTNTGDETLATIKSKLGITTLSGSNTGDQTITLTGDVTGSGTGSFATTIGTAKVVNSMLGNMVTKTYKGRTTAGTGVPEDVAVATLKTDLVLVKADVGLGSVVNADTTTTVNITDSTNKRFVTDGNLTTIGNQSGTNTGDNSANSLYSGLAASKQDVSGKDATGGYSGLTLFKINFKNAANTFTNFFTNATTAARTYTFPDKDITVAGLVDITGTNSGTNTGDQTISDATLTTTDITTNNASNTKHGFFPKVSGTPGQFVKVNAGGTGLDYANISGGGDMLAANNLSDVASTSSARNNILPSKTGNALKVLRVNSGETDYEVVNTTGTVYCVSNTLYF